jgi:acyl carrier protein
VARERRDVAGPLGRIRRMTPAEIQVAILDILAEIAPDEDLSRLKPEVPFRDQLDMDSMDFLDIVMELRKRYRIQIPEEEYPALASMASTIEYLEPRMKDVVKK